MAIAAETEEQWRGIANALALDDRRFNSMDARLQHADELNAAIGEVTTRWDKRAISQRIAAAGGICAPVMRVPELYGEPQIAASDTIERVTHPVAGARLMPRVPLRLNGGPLSTRLPAPTYGQHNAEVFCELLGLSETELADLDARGVISSTPHRGREAEPVAT